MKTMLKSSFPIFERRGFGNGFLKVKGGLEILVDDIGLVVADVFTAIGVKSMSNTFDESSVKYKNTLQ